MSITDELFQAQRELDKLRETVVKRLDKQADLLEGAVGKTSEK
jgi:hypothetical protein